MVEDAYPGESYWVGIDDRDGDEVWTTSLNQNYSKSDPIFGNNYDASKPCGLLHSGSNGLITLSNCKSKNRYVCETEKLDKPPTYPCPNEYIPYKDKCMMPNPKRNSYDAAENFCATKGGVILPIKDKGTLELIRSWGLRAVRNDVWVGLRKQRYTRTYDENLLPPLQEILTDELTYADGEPFDISSSFKLEAKILRGECFALKSSEEMELRDYKCGREIGFFCEWIRPVCPESENIYNFSHLGQLSSGRDCFGVGEASSFEQGTCNSQNDLLRSRWTPNNRYKIDLYRRAYG